MKKILIVNNNMHIGGVQKALVSLLWSIREQYDITLLLFSKSGECLKELPPEVKIITPRSAYRFFGITKYDSISLWEKIGRSVYALITRILGRSFAIRLMAWGQKTLTGYDVAISYLHNGGSKVFYGGCNDFVLRHVTAGKKVTFLHCDYRLCGADTEENKKQYAKFDAIAACSQGCADSFLQANPHLREKVTVVYNCHRFAEIQKKAEEAPATLTEGKINLVTVARLGKEKGVERALRVIAGLKEQKNKLHYYVIGDGIQKPLLQQIIREEKLEQTVTLCGMLANPYGYMKAADILLIPSYSEAAPLVIAEAAYLGTPILTMKTSSAKEMVEDSGYGWVCENTEEAMGKALSDLLADPATIQTVKNRLLKNMPDNTLAVSQFDKITV